MSWNPSESKAVAHTLHVAAMAGLIGPGYAKRDAKLRRAAGVEPASVEPPEGVLRTVLSDAFTTGETAWKAIDATWFSRRWDLGEEAAVAHQGRERIQALEPLKLGVLLAAEPHLQVSTAVGGQPVALAAPPLVVTSVDCSPRVIMVCALGAQMERLIGDSPLSPEDKRWMAEMMACTVIREYVGDVVFTDWVKPLMDYTVGEFARASAIEERVRQIARTCLDQPPGEVERIGVGLGRRLQSRLDRAIRRGFFTPPHVDLSAWLASKRNSKESS